MKKWGFGIGLLVLSGATACGDNSADAENPGATSLALSLRGEAGLLRLTQVSARPDYVATYPNPQKIGKMTVSVKRTGALAALCFDANENVIPCGDTPFFTSVSPITHGVHVDVVDVYGESCGGQDFPDGPTGTTGNDNAGSGSGSGSGGTKDGDNGKKGKDGSDSDDSCDDGSGGGSGGGSSGTCDDAGATTARNEFCAGVNAYLKNHDLPLIDCTTLDGSSYPKEKPPSGASGGACEDIWEPEYAKIDGWIHSCSSMEDRAVHWHDQVRWNLIHEGACSHSPLVLDLDGDGVNLTALGAGVSFDLLGTGEKVQAAWIDGKDALLVLDRNGNGSIDGAAELFGNSTDGRVFADGFAALAELDANDDGLVDARDPAFGELSVWRDTNRDGRSSPAELSTLAEVGVRRLDLGAVRTSGPSSWDRHGNRIPLVSAFERTDGTRSVLVDAYLRFKPL